VSSRFVEGAGYPQPDARARVDGRNNLLWGVTEWEAAVEYPDDGCVSVGFEKNHFGGHLDDGGCRFPVGFRIEDERLATKWQDWREMMVTFIETRWTGKCFFMIP
jgi:hypothetical protein